MSKPFCSTGEPWDKETDLKNHKDIWEVYHDSTNNDTILWIYVNDTEVELRMGPKGAALLSLCLVKSAVGDETYCKMVDFLKGEGFA